jgi:acetyl/propionyl-CoA carboxylase alpha subunit
VTEGITGLDLVKWQLRIASGEALDISSAFALGDRGAIVGHSIEVRIVAEDPGNGFLPSTGKILGWAEPKAPGVRVDTGFGVGAEISRFYDSLIAKVIVHGATRAESISKLRQALLDFHILGVKTNIGYLLDVVSHPDFEAGRIDTGFLGREFADWTPGAIPAELGVIVERAERTGGNRGASRARTGVWEALDSFRNTPGIR